MAGDTGLTVRTVIRCKSRFFRNGHFPPVPAEIDPAEGSVEQGTASLAVRFPSQHYGRGVLAHHRIVAVGLLTESELRLLGEGFSRAWPVDEAPCFTGLIEAIDEADRELWRARDRMTARPERS